MAVMVWLVLTGLHTCGVHKFLSVAQSRHCSLTERLLLLVEVNFGGDQVVDIDHFLCCGLSKSIVRLRDERLGSFLVLHHV
jgi:hypothetical protein